MGWKPMSWEYMASFLDGEGTVVGRDEFQTTGHIRRRFEVVWYNNYLPGLVEMQEFLAKNKITACIINVKRKDHRDGYQLEVRGAAQTYKTLLKMEPYLRVKETVADEVICYLNELIEAANDPDSEMGHRARSAYLAIERS